MYEGQMVFAQLMEFLPRRVFDTCVRRYRGNQRVRGFSCRDQSLAMAFAQLTGRESLREVEICLRAVRDKLYHSGFRAPIARSTLADANRRKYPDRLRRISYVNHETGRRLIFVTNHFDLPALTISDLYRERWTLELFFKWVKQHLRIKHFLGNTPNAVKTQIWIAVSTYVLVAILKRELNLDRSLYEILQILSVTLFEKTPLITVLNDTRSPNLEGPRPNQKWLFDF